MNFGRYRSIRFRGTTSAQSLITQSLHTVNHRCARKSRVQKSNWIIESAHLWGIAASPKNGPNTCRDGDKDSSLLEPCLLVGTAEPRRNIELKTFRPVTWASRDTRKIESINSNWIIDSAVVNTKSWWRRRKNVDG